MARNTLRILFGMTLALVANFAWAQPQGVNPASYDPNPAAYGDPYYTGNAPGGFPVNSYGPNSPAVPTNPMRPAGWPGAAPNAATQVQLPGGNVPSGAAEVAPPPSAPVPFKDPTERPYEPAAILAHVGPEVVQAAEILPIVNQTLEGYLAKVEVADQVDKMPEDMKEKQLAMWHKELVKRTLDDTIKIKLLIADVKAVAPKEGIDKNIENMRKGFNDQELKRLRDFYKATSVADLENKLRAHGGSLESQRTAFIEKNLAVGWATSQIKEKKEPSHEQMVNYYREHISDWEHPARARWELLTARYDKFPTKADAWRAIAGWGTQIQNGAPFADVAKANSQGHAAHEGGLNDWTTHGSLRSAVIEQAIFGLPVGVLSQILSDEEGFHIVRVVEREEQHITPFIDVQPDIKKKLFEGGRMEAMNEYIEKLRERLPVHTIYDEGSPLATAPTTVR